MRWPRVHRAVAVLALTVVGCGGEGAPTDPPDPVPTTVTVTPDSHRFEALGVTLQFAAEVRDQHGDVIPSFPVEWGSSHPSVVSVDRGGLATSVSEGDATISVRAETATGRSEVQVERVNSREHPAERGETVRLMTEGSSSGDATIQLTLLRTVKGAAALDTVLTANRFNDEPPAGYEYVLARFRLEVVQVSGAGTFRMRDTHWESFSRGRLNPDPSVCCLENALEGEGFAGARWEGWIPLFVERGDGLATAVYQRERSGETWFAL